MFGFVQSTGWLFKLVLFNKIDRRMSNIDKWAGLNPAVFVHSWLGVRKNGGTPVLHYCGPVSVYKYPKQYVVTFESLNICVTFILFYSSISWIFLYSNLYLFMFNITQYIHV